MNKLKLSVHIFLFSTLAALAQSPEKMSYQAIIRNGTNALLANSNVGIKVSVLQGSATGSPVFVETHTTSTNINGLTTIEIGGGSAVTGTFAAINWGSGIYFIKTETDPAGGNNYTITSTSQLLSVPYSLYSKSSDDSNRAKTLIYTGF